MSPTKDQVVERLRRVKGPDMQSNIVDLGLVSEVLVKDGRVSFSITVPAERGGGARAPAPGGREDRARYRRCQGVMAVLTAESRAGWAAAGASAAPHGGHGAGKRQRVNEARAKATAHGPPPAAAPGGGRRMPSRSPASST